MLDTLITAQTPTPMIAEDAISIFALSIIDDIYFLFTLKCTNYKIGGYYIIFCQCKHAS